MAARFNALIVPFGAIGCEASPVLLPAERLSWPLMPSAARPSLQQCGMHQCALCSLDQ